MNTAKINAERQAVQAIMRRNTDKPKYSTADALAMLRRAMKRALGGV